MNRKLTISALQSFPACNLNTDENGAPKRTTYGGTERWRVSSQAWKAAIRRAFRDSGDTDLYATRTKLSPEMIIDEIIAIDPSITRETAVAAITKALAVLKPSKAAKRAQSRSKDAKAADAPASTEDVSGEVTTDALFTVSTGQVRAVATLIVTSIAENAPVNPKEFMAAMSANVSAEQALFGRFFADTSELSIDATCQVAHAMGTAPIPEGFDYFVGRDDLLDSGEAEAGDKGRGAGHLGVKEFASGPLYRYATIDFDQLVTALGDESAALKSTAAFIDAFLRTVPRGGQNSYGANTVPDTILIEVSGDTLNYSPAFETPAATSEIATKALAQYVAKTTAVFGREKKAFALTLTNANIAGFGAKEVASVSEIVDNVLSELSGGQ